MSLPRPLPCAFYRTTAGNEPVREWLKALPEGERKQVGSDIKAVQYGWPLGLPLVDSLGNGNLGSPFAAALPNRTNNILRARRNGHPPAWFY